MATRTTTLGFLLGALLAGCFGAGPPVTEASGVTVVYVVPALDNNQRCNGSAVYLSDVVIGTTEGYAVTLPYSPDNCDNGGGNPDGTTSIVSFLISGANPAGANLMSDTMTNSERPRVATAGSGGMWLTENGGSLGVGPGTTSLMNPGNGQSFSGQLGGLVVDSDALYFAANQNAAGFIQDAGDPQFPSGSNNAGGGNQAGFWKVTLPVQTGQQAATPIGPQVALALSETKDALVANSTQLFFMASGDTSSAGSIGAIAKTDTTGAYTPVDTIPSNLASQVVPVGLAADDAHVAWAAAIDATAQRTLPAGCWIWSRDLTTGITTQLLATSSFSCMDVALDAQSVYFAIVRSESDEDCNGCSNLPLHGAGIGRVSLAADHKLETLDFGITAFGAGPRRVVVDATSVYAIDPLAVGKLDKSELDDQLDIAP